GSFCQNASRRPAPPPFSSMKSIPALECEDTVMGFSAEQVQALRRGLSNRHVRTREANGRELSYIEGWFAISEANRIFGFDGWNRETIESRCVRGKIAVCSRSSTSPGCASPCMPKAQRSFGKVTAQVKDAVI